MYIFKKCPNFVEFVVHLTKFGLKILILPLQLNVGEVRGLSLPPPLSNRRNDAI